MKNDKAVVPSLKSFGFGTTAVDRISDGSINKSNSSNGNTLMSKKKKEHSPMKNKKFLTINGTSSNELWVANLNTVDTKKNSNKSNINNNNNYDDDDNVNKYVPMNMLFVSEKKEERIEDVDIDHDDEPKEANEDEVDKDDDNDDAVVSAGWLSSSSSCFCSCNKRRTLFLTTGSILVLLFFIMIFVVVAATLLGIFFSPSSSSSSSSSSSLSSVDSTYNYEYTKIGSYELIETVPHDENAFTQGLEILSYEKIQIMMNNIHTTTTTTNQNNDQNTNDSDSGNNITIETDTDTNTNTDNNTLNYSSSTLSSSTPTLPPSLLLSNNYYLESTGRYGQSSLRIVELSTGIVIQELTVDDSFFAEGCTYYYVPPPPEKEDVSITTSSDKNVITLRIVQLSWQSGRGFVYELSIPTTTTATSPVALNTTSTSTNDFPTLQRRGEFTMEDYDSNSLLTTNGQGWGITYYPLTQQFIISDGTEYLHFWELIEEEREENNEKPPPPGISASTFTFNLVHKIRITRRLEVDSVSGTDNDNGNGNDNGNDYTIIMDNNNDSYWTSTVDQINELEWDPYYKNGTTVLANLWNTNYIVRIQLPTSSSSSISPSLSASSSFFSLLSLSSLLNENNNHEYHPNNVGKVLYQYDLADITNVAFNNNGGSSIRWGAVLNGIAFAYDSSTTTSSTDTTTNDINTNTTTTTMNEFWVTGKYWPTMFRIRLD